MSSTVDDLTVHYPLLQKEETPFATALWSAKYQDAREPRARTFLAFSFQLLKFFFPVSGLYETTSGDLNSSPEIFDQIYNSMTLPTVQGISVHLKYLK